MTVERKNMATVKAAAASYPYIEDVFSTYIYLGDGATQSVVNNIDLSGKGGMVWFKSRSGAYGTSNHAIGNTVVGPQKLLYPNTTGASVTNGALNTFNSNGFTISDSTPKLTNGNSTDYVSWTFRKQAKFFDVVSYTGTGSARTIAHSLGSTPGMIIVKRTDTTSDWRVYHSGLTSASYYLGLNQSAAQVLDTTIWNATAPTSSVFSVGTDATVNASGGTYIAYLFASNAGGFGSAGTDNVITCGSFTTDGSGNATVTLGYEPQYFLYKPIATADLWYLSDIMRGLTSDINQQTLLYPNDTYAEAAGGSVSINATGLSLAAVITSTTYIYMAIRRGPMKTPTSGTSVFSPITSSAAAGTDQTTNFVVDTQIAAKRTGADANRSAFMSRLTGNSSTTSESSVFKITSSTSSLEQTTPATLTRYWNNTGFQNPTYYASTSSIYWNFARAPGFHDVVCYTGTGSATTITHNLGVVPELIICVKRTNSSGASIFVTPVYCSGLTSASYLVPLSQTTAESLDTTYWNATAPTSSVFSVGTSAQTNSGGTYVAYLFATLSGVSKVGTYTGTAAALNIDCGFAAGARFVMIKRINSTGSWYVYDTARGINASGTNDPYIVFNTASAEVTNTDYLATYSSGFALTSSGSATVNVSGSTYIYLAIA